MMANLPTVRNLFSGRHWRDFFTRGKTWFVAYGRVYRLDSSETRRTLETVQAHGFPGRKGQLFRLLGSVRSRGAAVADSVLITGLGRLGNGIQQFLHAFSFSRAFGVEEVLFFPNHSTRVGPNATSGNPSFSSLHRPFKRTKRAPVTIWRSDFFESGQRVHEFDDGSAREARDALRSIYESLLTEGMNKAPILTIHIRSGDVFGPLPHPDYGQPPFAFYQRVLRESAWERVEIVSEDASSPCHGAVIEQLNQLKIPYELIGEDFTDAVKTLAQSSNLVASRGTFCPAILYLSDTPKTVFVFGHDMDKIPGGRQHTYRHIIDSLGTYNEQVLRSNWKNSAQQRKIMLDYPLDALSEDLSPSD